MGFGVFKFLSCWVCSFLNDGTGLWSLETSIEVDTVASVSKFMLVRPELKISLVEDMLQVDTQL